MGVIDDRIAKLEKRLAAFERQVGKPGTGECFCRKSPEWVLKQMERVCEPPEFKYVSHNDMLLDHRCPVHGEKAQPAVWGRHKDFELSVTFKQWESLSVTYKE